MRRVEGPKDLPHARHQLLDAFVRAIPAQQAEFFGLADQIEAMGEANATVARSLMGADLYWVTADMTRVAFDAAQDLPEWSAGLAAPSPRGLLVWAGGLPPITWTNPLPDVTDPHLRIGGIAWSRAGGGVLVQLLAHSGDIARLSPRFRMDTGVPMWPVEAFTLPILEPAGIPADVRLPEGKGVVSLIGATWIMMQQEQVVARREIRTPGADAARAERLGLPQPLITLVDLRPMRTVRPPREEDHEPTRHLTVRHVVRGHWRQQFYRSDGSHRPKWINSYLKGPEGAPLHLTEPVMVWRR